MSDKDIENIKEKLKQNIVSIVNFDEVNNLLYFNIKDKYIIFDNVTLKNYFVSNTDRPVINCNSSYEKFIYEMNTCFCENTVFNNINFCNDFRILDMIDKTNNLRLE